MFKKLVNHYGSRLTQKSRRGKKLPGIGDYTGNALGLIHNRPTIALDGNVKRVFSRNFKFKKIKLILKNLFE